MSVLIVAFGGAIGAVARYFTYLWIQSQVGHHFPWATLLINSAGCFAVGVLMVFIEKAVPYHQHLLLIGVTGFLGNFTTFSTFGFETIHLIRTDQFGWASINVAANVMLGLIAVWFGRLVALQKGL